MLGGVGAGLSRLCSIKLDFGVCFSVRPTTLRLNNSGLSVKRTKKGKFCTIRGVTFFGTTLASIQSE